ncbi:MAG TPA: CPBP family intramembrane glutamic endopeptidase, partial [Longimicrobiaceae bacterium]
MRDDAPAPSGRPLRALLLYLAAVFAGGALLAPWLYAAVQGLAPSVPALRELAGMPFARYVNRALLVMALAGLPFYLRGAGIRRWADAGVEPGRVAWRRFGAGFVLGIVSLAAVCAVALLAGGRRLAEKPTAGELAAEAAGALLTGVVVGVMEELLFRGAMFGGLRRAMRWPAALLLSSAVYAIVHFLGRPANPPEVTWLSGFHALPGMLAGMADPRAVLPGFLSLTLAGVILGLAYQRTGDLAASIGIHAGWIFWLKFYGFMTRRAE